jgi:N-acyl amino acid synthase of PEP-CTERM/exosortase system
MSTVNQDIAESFSDYFDMIPASTASLRESVYRLRYQVYCLETGFVSCEEYPDGLEHDVYDKHSAHYLIRHRMTGLYAGTTRLILQGEDNKFPIEQFCKIDRSDLLAGIPRESIAEVSRFCVSKFFKRRPGELGTIAGIGPQGSHHYRASEEERRTWPHMTVALIAALHKMSFRYEKTHWFALMEPALFRLLRQIGIEFVAIGPLTEFYGQRQPCLLNVVKCLERIRVDNPYLWNLFTDSGNYWESEQSAA